MAVRPVDNRVTQVRFLTGPPSIRVAERFNRSLKRIFCRRCTPSRRAMRNRCGLPPQPSRRWIRSVKPDWRWSGLLTRAQVVRNHPDPPIKDQCPQRPRERILNPSTQVTVGSSPTWSSISKNVRRKSGFRKDDLLLRPAGDGRLTVDRVAASPRFIVGSAILVERIPYNSCAAQFGSAPRSGTSGPQVSRHTDQSRSWSQMGRLAAHNGHMTVFDPPQDYQKTGSGLCFEGVPLAASTRGGRHVSKLPRAGSQRGFPTA